VALVPLALAALLVLILSALWFFAVARFIRAGEWGAPSREAVD